MEEVKKSGLSTIEPPEVKKHTEPWSPAKLLQVKAIPGWRLQWMRKDTLSERLEEGWEVVKGKDLISRTVIDGSQMDSTVTKRNLILCKMPEDLAKQMDAYHDRKAAEAIEDSVRAFEASGDKGLSYGSIKVSHE